MSKCKGCGITLQNNDINGLGYTPKLTNKLCERCFKITNYNYHESISKALDNDKICSNINQKKAFTFFLCDILSLNDKIIDIFKRINNPKILVITKMDFIPKNIDIAKMKQRIINNYNLSDLLFVSIKNSYGKEDILEYVNIYQKVIFAGPTSSGKSSLINFLFNFELTVSNHKNTTQEFINLNYEGKTIIDAPGFTYDNFKEIKVSGLLTPKTLILKKDYELCIDDLVISSSKDINITIYLPKNILYKTRKCKEKIKYNIKIDNNSDVVIKNIGFIYFKDMTSIYVSNDTFINTRLSIVGGR